MMGDEQRSGRTRRTEVCMMDDLNLFFLPFQVQLGLEEVSPFQRR